LGLIVAFLAGCASSNSGGSDGDGRSGRKSITLWHHQTAGEGPGLIQQAVDRFKSSHPDVDVEVVPINNDAYKTKIKVAMGAGNAPCIFPTWGGGTLREYVKANQVIDLTSRISKDNYKDRFLDASFTQITFDGKIYGVPI